MIYEQAFYNLPEILVGLHYLEQEYETGINGAFAMAVLQELNGRNVNNPISHIRLEHKYPVLPGTAARSVRTDMFLRTQAVRVANRALDAYGWRFQNYLEAKFIRESGNQTITRGQLAVDLVRLACFARSHPPLQDSAGRYLLHVYKGKPEDLIGGKLTLGGKPRKNYQSWIGEIRVPGVSTVTLDVAKDSVKGVTGRFPAPLNTLKLTFQARTLEIAPLWIATGAQYWCYLTKLETVRVDLGARWFNIALDRTVTEGTVGDRDSIWADVYSGIDP